jgi:hypothetical protein
LHCKISISKKYIPLNILSWASGENKKTLAKNKALYNDLISIHDNSFSYEIQHTKKTLVTKKKKYIHNIPLIVLFTTENRTKNITNNSNNQRNLFSPSSSRPPTKLYHENNNHRYYQTNIPLKRGPCSLQVFTFNLSSIHFFFSFFISSYFSHLGCPSLLGWTSLFDSFKTMVIGCSKPSRKATRVKDSLAHDSSNHIRKKWTYKIIYQMDQNTQPRSSLAKSC